MAYFSYKIEHDYGLAPNPFGGVCTLAVCKPTIRMNKNLKIGDWIIGTGSSKLKRLHHLIYLMEVNEKITLNEYWNDPRFQFKKPIKNGSLVQLYGDNIYHVNKHTKKWIQVDSAHSLSDGLENIEHLKADTNGKYVLISFNFYYFGDNSIIIPEKFHQVCNKGRNMKSDSINTSVASSFLRWVKSKYNPGIHGDPINWKL